MKDYNDEDEEKVLEKKKKELLPNISKEDFRKLVYIAAEMTYNNKNVKSKRNFWNISEKKRKAYISCAERSALKAFSSNPNLVIDTLSSIGKNTPKGIKDIVLDQLLFDSCFNEVLYDYVNSEHRENVLEQYSIEACNRAEQEVDSEESNQFFEKIKDAIETEKYDEKIKESVLEYWLSYVKINHPDISQEDQELFKESLLNSINRKYDSWDGSSIMMDWDPGYELVEAYSVMEDLNEKSINHFLDIRSVFPAKTTTHTEKGKCAYVDSEFEKSKYLYMTPSFIQEKKQSIQTSIEEEEAKIPEEEKEKFSRDYEEKLRLQDLLDTYNDQVESIENLEIGKEEKNARKQELISEIEQLRQKYKDKFDNTYRPIYINKEKWLEKKYVQYERDQTRKLYKEWNKAEHSMEEVVPDHSHIPDDLSSKYEQRDMVIDYEKTQENTIEQLPEDKIQFFSILADTYIQMLKEEGYIDTDTLSANKLQEYKNRLLKYFSTNFINLLDEDTLSDFNKKNIFNVISIKNKGHYEYNINIELEDGIIYTYEVFSDRRVVYAIPDILEQMIENLRSRIRYCQDIGEKDEICGYEKQLEELLEYRDQKTNEDPTLKELDDRKLMLEQINENTKRQYEELNYDKNEELLNED